MKQTNFLIISILSLLTSCAVLNTHHSNSRVYNSSRTGNTCQTLVGHLISTKITDLSMGQQILKGSSGVEIEGNLVKTLKDSEGRIIYFNTDGPTKLKYLSKVLEGQDVAQHPHGFGSPVGNIKEAFKPLEDLTQQELKNLNLIEGERVLLNYVSGVQVDGQLTGIVRKDGKILIMTFEDATVYAPDGTKLFEPEWGPFDMTVLRDFR
jgi:hypothetical protein